MNSNREGTPQQLESNDRAARPRKDGRRARSSLTWMPAALTAVALVGALFQSSPDLGAYFAALFGLVLNALLVTISQKRTTKFLLALAGWTWFVTFVVRLMALDFLGAEPKFRGLTSFDPTGPLSTTLIGFTIIALVLGLWIASELGPTASTPRGASWVTSATGVRLLFVLSAVSLAVSLATPDIGDVVATGGRARVGGSVGWLFRFVPTDALGFLTLALFTRYRRRPTLLYVSLIMVIARDALTLRKGALLEIAFTALVLLMWLFYQRAGGRRQRSLSTLVIIGLVTGTVVFGSISQLRRQEDLGIGGPVETINDLSARVTLVDSWAVVQRRPPSPPLAATEVVINTANGLLLGPMQLPGGGPSLGTRFGNIYQGKSLKATHAGQWSLPGVFRGFGLPPSAVVLAVFVYGAATAAVVRLVGRLRIASELYLGAYVAGRLIFVGVLSGNLDRVISVTTTDVLMILFWFGFVAQVLEKRRSGTEENGGPTHHLVGVREPQSNTGAR